jgi:glycerate dehydrogenase
MEGDILKIVVLDGYSLNPGDMTWDPIHRIGHATIYDRTPDELIVERARDAHVVLTNKTPLTRETLAQLPQLRYIGVLATGYHIVDLDATADAGIVVTNVPSYGTSSVAQFTFAMILELCHHIGIHSEDVKSGGWCRNPDFSYRLSPLIELYGKTIGIIGYGRIGQDVATIAHAFGMQVCVARSEKSEMSVSKRNTDVNEVSLEQLLMRADVVTLHCPLLPSTEGIMNRQRLSWMKQNAILINTARGGLLVDQDVADALNSERIYGAGLDVLTLEPPDASNPLLRARNCLITPHIAWATWEARSRLMDTAASNLRAYVQGSPQNQIKS